MKNYLLAVGILSILTCVKEPTIKDTSSKPEKAVPITFENIESSLPRNKVAIIEFYSENCLLCQSLSWVIDSLYEDFSEIALVGANNIEEDSLYKRFDISTVPTYIFFKNGAEVKRFTFFQNKQEIYDTLALFLEKTIKDTLPQTDTIRDTIPIDTIDTTDTIDYPFLDSLSFDSLVLKNNKISMVVFLNPMGPPCIYMDSIVKTILPRFKNRVFISKVDAWRETSLSNQYNITFVPQFLFFKKGIEIPELRIIGEVSADSLYNILENLIVETGKEYLINLTPANFDSVVKRENSVAMVEFFSPTCGGCIYMEDKVAELALMFAEIVTIGKVNVSLEESDSLRTSFGVRAWPTFIFFKDGEEYYRQVGITEVDTLAEKLNSILNIQ